MADAVEPSGYITAMAASARVARAVLSTGTDPMTVREFKCKVNIGADLNVDSQTDVGLNIRVLSVTHRAATVAKARDAGLGTPGADRPPRAAAASPGLPRERRPLNGPTNRFDHRTVG
ncbi:hypothetical protein [Streptomyces venezuelae]|uniref:hypothetical protein n=1 Tax=Streptomyces venezuelae TaxID=54571 RepID=UPI0034295DFB